jgi:hypothetical protein
MGNDRDEQRAVENVRKAVSETFVASGAHQATEARLADAKADIAFAIFLFFVSVLTFMCGVSEQEHKPVDGAVIKLLAAVPFLGGAWRMHRGHKAFRDRALALQAKADQIARKTGAGPS